MSVSGITAGRDGNVWYVDVGQNVVGRITPAGVITQFPVPAAGAGPEAITASPDGNIWMVSPGTTAPKILRVGQSGDIAQFPLPEVTEPIGITSGPDGNVWFTGILSGVGRMTPAGKVTEFPTPGKDLRGIVAGPDHNLWFVEADIPAIARMTLKGTVTEFPLGGSASDPQVTRVLVVGPDGNLWFAETAGLGRMTLKGQITQFPLPGKVGPSGVAVGPDHNVWFTDANANSVGRISADGTIREFPLPHRNSGPFGITAGTDGRMWFTESYAGRIGAIGAEVPEVAFVSGVVNFGTASAPATRTVTVTNTGNGALQIASVVVAGPDQAAFKIAGETCSGKTLVIGAQCKVDVTFGAGLGTGFEAARLEFADNATASPQVVSLVAQLADCKLPVVVRSADASQGKFLRILDGAATDDPNSGLSPVFYDRALGRWLPVNSSLVSPDGTRYVYVASAPDFNDVRVHVVDVATGRDRTLSLPSNSWSLLAFTREGIYAHFAFEGVAPGLSLIDPDSGAVRQVFADAAVYAVADGAAWLGVLNPQDPNPPTGGIDPHPPNEVAKRDLVTGTTTTWLYRPGTALHLVAASGGKLLVSGADDKGVSSYWVVSGPNQAEALTVPETGDALPYSDGFVSDAQGVWLGTSDGIYLWTAHTGAALVSDVVAVPASTCA